MNSVVCGVYCEATPRALCGWALTESVVQTKQQFTYDHAPVCGSGWKTYLEREGV